MSNPNPTSNLQLDTLDENGNPPKKSRLQDVDSAKGLYTILQEADRKASANRSEIDAMFDGAPPYREEDLKASGQSFRTNLNFDEASAMLETAMAQYVDIQSSVENLIELKVNYGEESLRSVWEDKIAEIFSGMVRSWEDYSFNFLMNANNFVKQGVSVVYFENEFDWRWKPSKLGDFLIPHNTQATESKVEVAMAVRPCSPSELYQMIEDEGAAKELGWNIPEVRQAIMKADGDTSRRSNNWEEYEIAYKNNDIYTSARATLINLLHIWVTEFDGTVSHFISLKDGANEDFLFKNFSLFNNIHQAFTFFTYGIGTNGYYHGIRGLGFKIFPHIQVSNRVRCSGIDGAVMASSVLLKPENEAALEDITLSYYGPFAIMSPGLEVTPTGVPNLSNNIMPVLADMDNLVKNKSGQYSTDNVFNRGGERSKFEVNAHLEQVSRLNITSLNLFYEPWEKLLREMVRRVVDPSYPLDLGGGKEVAEFRARLEAAGVPAEALAAVDIDSVRAVRAVGAGSAAARQITSERVMELSKSFDAVGQEAAVRDLTVELVGHQKADRYAPKPNAAERVPLDAKFANLENVAMENGDAVPAYENDTQMLHLDSHLTRLDFYVEGVNSGQIDPRESYEVLVLLHGHSSEHLSFIEGDPTLELQANEIRQVLQQSGEIIHNVGKSLQAEQRDAQQAQQEAQVAGQEIGEQTTADAEAQRIDEATLKLDAHRTNLKIAEEKHRDDMRIKSEKAKQDLAINDAKAAQAYSQKAQQV